MISESEWQRLKCEEEKGMIDFAICKVIEEGLMKEDKQCRNDDTYLVREVWKKKQFSPSTITRVRRQIQNSEGRLLPTDPKVLIRRKVREDIIHSYYASNQSLLHSYTMERYGVK